MSEIKRILIGGKWREAAETFAVKNPFSNELIAEVFSANPAKRIINIQ